MSVGIRLAEGVHEKTPEEVTTFAMTFAGALGDLEAVSTVLESEVIDDDQPSVGPVVVIDSVQVANPLVNVVLSGGTAGATNVVKVKIRTNLGQELEGAVLVRVASAVETT